MLNSALTAQNTFSLYSHQQHKSPTKITLNRPQMKKIILLLTCDSNGKGPPFFFSDFKNETPLSLGRIKPKNKLSVKIL